MKLIELGVMFFLRGFIIFVLISNSEDDTCFYNFCCMKGDYDK